MSELDKRIEEALSAEDRALLEQFGEQGIFGQLGSLFSGKMAWISIITFIVGLAMFVLVVYAAIQFVHSVDVPSMLKWGALAWVGGISLCMIKMWGWMRMESNRVIREVKRLELQIARMSLQSK